MTPRLKKLIFLFFMILAIWFFSPILMGLYFYLNSGVSYRTQEPTASSPLLLPQTNISLTLWTKSAPRAMSYEGAFRVLEVTQPSKPSHFYELAPTLAGYGHQIEVDWFENAQLIHLTFPDYDRGHASARLDLGRQIMFEVYYPTNGLSMHIQSRTGLPERVFPEFRGDRVGQAKALGQMPDLPSEKPIRVGVMGVSP